MTGKSWKKKDVGPTVKPTGELQVLKPSDIKPSTNNPRLLFDPEPLRELKESISNHGVLVPLTVYKIAGATKFAIIDGERRYRCCKELNDEGHPVEIPVNIVHAPDKLGQMIYMFNIHSFREQWELMPTALGLQSIIDELELTEEESIDVDELHEITGLSKPQIKRCLTILSFPFKYQRLSLEVNTKSRIPSNFWIEVNPVLEHAKKFVPEITSSTQDGSIEMLDKLVEKYRDKKIKSVIHFRRIMEAIDVAEGDRDRLEQVNDRIREFVLDPSLETRSAFDGFIVDKRRYDKALDACNDFMKQMQLSKVDNSLDGRKEIIAKLRETKNYIDILIERMEGEDPNADDE